MVLPFSPAALNGVEWAITAGWVLIGVLILALFGNKHAAGKQAKADVS